MTTFTATYSPEDNKLRLRASSRLPQELYARVRAAGFIWAPKQDLFVAPMWTPSRADMCMELAGAIGDEDTTMVERAEIREERFENYSEKRAAESERAHARVQEICDGIPLGQPILVGHHSEKHARKDQQRIESGMRKAINLWDTAVYWESRAKACVAHALYKEQPGVRARRIKGIEADLRKRMKQTKESELFLKLWEKWECVKKTEGETTDLDRALYIAGREPYNSYCFPLSKFPRDFETYEGDISIHCALERRIITPTWARESRMKTHAANIAYYARWIAHYELRLGYEKAMLAEAGASSLLDKPKRRELPPLLNYKAASGALSAFNMYVRNEVISYPQIEMTAADYAAINKDYKGTRESLDKSHRFRTCLRPRPAGGGLGSGLVSVFLTDSKVHTPPTAAGALGTAAE